MKKRLIINADDFGLSKSVNQGIIDGYKKGVITSATIMANMPGFLDAVLKTKRNPGLGVGVHLNIYRGRPLSFPGAIPSLVNNKGNFFASSRLVQKIYLKKINPQEIEKELKAQIIKVKEAGIPITHLDSEKHFHVFPIVSEVVLKLACYFQIKKIRLPYEKWYSKDIADLFSSQFYKMQYLAWRSQALIPYFQRRDIKTIDNFYGILYSRKINLRSFLAILSALAPGVSEIMVHPGYVDQELRLLSQRLGYNLLDSRAQELKVLLDPYLKEQNNIQLIHYGQF